jgi:hypothetical protein
VNRLKAQLPALDAAMVPTSAGGHVPVGVNDEVHALIRAINRKARFAEMHLAVLNGINWESSQPVTTISNIWRAEGSVTSGRLCHFRRYGFREQVGRLVGQNTVRQAQLRVPPPQHPPEPRQRIVRMPEHFGAAYTPILFR